MGNVIEFRWFQWDKWYNSGEFGKIVNEFDVLLRQKETICMGDLSRRDSALEAMGITSIAKYNEANQNGTKK